MLQWGRDQLIAELRLYWEGDLFGNKLQWGRDQLIAEFKSASTLRDPATMASMGPRSADRGIEAGFSFINIDTEGFNGAAIS